MANWVDLEEFLPGRREWFNILNYTVNPNTSSNVNGPNIRNGESNPLVSHVDINMLIILGLLTVVLGSIDQI